MLWSSLVGALALVAPTNALIRFGCSQLVVDRLDPLVQPGVEPSAHLHQIVGGNTFNVTMDPNNDIASMATCTTCQFSEDFSNYWTAVLFFKHKNGTYKRVPQIGNLGFDNANGGMTIYYMQDALYNMNQSSKVTAFKKGFRMIVGNPTITTKEDARKFRQITYTCLQDMATRGPETMEFPTSYCPAGILANVRFPTCWDGKNLDSPNHASHMAYPISGTFESGGPCPDSHPVRVPQLFYETNWDTREFKDLWPADGTSPLTWSQNGMGTDREGYGSHADYVFGWKGDALQRAMDSNCYVNCTTLKTQTMEEQNKCSLANVVKEPIDGWLPQLPGNPTG
ncbi:uncharacterized protein LY89DRAFT_618505 [Mollisia scopiformis]|uniref:DUF1996 domain-containing protein n=1 Tax=Mollisia scopiformis TaxID=149040 RepID=A0A194X6Q5_MOLSC|nr:uncharacterized protein LY89DRAFT_618505 [Mollisia scopiformis]KUJ15853.1 hypothetical protein LY89DRAFT_618505 [Mollisia scopiformis]